MKHKSTANAALLYIIADYNQEVHDSRPGSPSPSLFICNTNAYVKIAHMVGESLVMRFVRRLIQKNCPLMALTATVTATKKTRNSVLSKF